jgi:uncharacterized protein YueI
MDSKKPIQQISEDMKLIISNQIEIKKDLRYIRDHIHKTKLEEIRLNAVKDAEYVTATKYWWEN